MLPLKNKTTWAKKGIQRRIACLIVFYTLVLSMLYSLMLLAYAWVVEDNIFNRLVQNEALYLQQVYQDSGKIKAPRLEFINLYQSKSSLPGKMPQLLEQEPQRVEFVLDTGTTVHITPVLFGEREMILAADISAYEVSVDFLPGITLWLLLILSLLICIGLMLAIRVSGYTLKPLKSLTDAVSSSKQQPISAGFAATYPRDEVGYLAQTFEDTLLHKQAMLKRESDFTRDVSHELRTPLTVQCNIVAKLASVNEFSAPDVEALQRSTSKMQNTLSCLLALARQESMERRQLGLLSVLEKAILSHVQAKPDSLLAFELKVAAGVKVLANENLLQHLFANLIDNAQQHAYGQKLCIQYQDTLLRFSNTVAENEHKHPQELFNDNVKGKTSLGLGQGLYLVKRICEVCDWQVQYRVEQGEFEVIIQT